MFDMSRNITYQQIVRKIDVNKFIGIKNVNM